MTAYQEETLDHKAMARSQAWWQRSVVLVTWGAEAGGYSWLESEFKARLSNFVSYLEMKTDDDDDDDDQDKDDDGTEYVRSWVQSPVSTKQNQLQVYSNKGSHVTSFRFT